MSQKIQSEIDQEEEFKLPEGYFFADDAVNKSFLSAMLRFDMTLKYGKGLEEDTEYAYNADGDIVFVLWNQMAIPVSKKEGVPHGKLETYS